MIISWFKGSIIIAIQRQTERALSNKSDVNLLAVCYAKCGTAKTTLRY